MVALPLEPQFPHLQGEGDNQVFPDSLKGMVSDGPAGAGKGAERASEYLPVMSRDRSCGNQAASSLLGSSPEQVTWASGPLFHALCVVRDEGLTSFKEALKEPGCGRLAQTQVLSNPAAEDDGSFSLKPEPPRPL